VSGVELIPLGEPDAAACEGEFCELPAPERVE
jgi:hypothetical protein